MTIARSRLEVSSVLFGSKIQDPRSKIQVIGRAEFGR